MSDAIQVHKINRSEIQQLKFDLPDFDSITTALPAGLYTTFRTYARRTKVIGLRSHLDRLYLPAKMDALSVVLRHPEDLREVLSDLLKHCEAAEARVRLILDKTQEPGTIYVLLQPMNPLPSDIYTDGVCVETSKSSRDQPSLKQTAFISESVFDRKRVVDSVFEILLTGKGRILEGITSNFFYVLNGVLCTAGRGVLIGVTRQTVIALARKKHIEVSYKALPLNDVPLVQEAFLTSSSRGIVPIVSIDGQPIADGKVGETTRKLMKLYGDEVLGLAEEIVQQ